jgi:hypothetical protein
MWRGGGLEVRILAPLVQVHTRKGPDKLKLEQRLNDSAASTASPGDHLTFYPNIPLIGPMSEGHVPHRILVKAHILRARRVLRSHTLLAR